MMGLNICFNGVIWKIIPKLSLLPLLIWSAGYAMILICQALDMNYASFIKVLKYWDT